jgi:hypothetical protein
MFVPDYIQLNIVDWFLYLQQDLKNLKKKKSEDTKKKKNWKPVRVNFN